MTDSAMNQTKQPLRLLVDNDWNYRAVLDPTSSDTTAMLRRENLLRGSTMRHIADVTGGLLMIDARRVSTMETPWASAHLAGSTWTKTAGTGNPPRTADDPSTVIETGKAGHGDVALVRHRDELYVLAIPEACSMEDVEVHVSTLFAQHQTVLFRIVHEISVPLNPDHFAVRRSPPVLRPLKATRQPHQERGEGRR